MSKKNKTRNIDEQLQRLLWEEYGEEYVQWYKKTFDVKLYFDGAETSDRGYLTDREFDEWKDEKWKQFLTRYGY